MSFRGRTFASLFTQAAENATSSVRTVKGVNNASTQVARAVSSGRGVGTSSGVRAVMEKPKMVTELFGDIPGIRTDLVSSARQSYDDILEDLDYALGPHVVHASNKEGLSEIAPMAKSAAAQQGAFGLEPDSAVAFAYNPLAYKDNAKILVHSMLETASEANVKAGVQTAYLAKAPLSGLSDDIGVKGNGWYMSFKPLRVLDSEPLNLSNTRRVEDMIRRSTGELSPEQKSIMIQQQQEADRAALSSKKTLA
jgi:hypothetical protein